MFIYRFSTPDALATDRPVLSSSPRCILTDPISSLPLPLPPRSTLFPYTPLFRSPKMFPAPEKTGALPKKMPLMPRDRKSTRLNSSHVAISYAVFCLKKKTNTRSPPKQPERKEDKAWSPYKQLVYLNYRGKVRLYD